jgi:hypothetical protein
VEWAKADAAAEKWAGGVSPKLLWAEVRAGRLRAARIGAGRNLLFCEAWIDEWLTGRDTTKTAKPGAA